MWNNRKKIISILLIFALLAPSSFATSYDRTGVIHDIYQNLSTFSTNFSVDYYGDFEALGDINSLVKSATSYDDYIYFSLNEYNFSYEYLGKNAKLAIEIGKGVNSEQQLTVDQFVVDSLKSLKLEGQSDYWRATKIMTFMDQNFKYDDSLVIHDAYTLIQKKIGVCQAYSLLFYKMAKGAGLEVDLQEGTLDGGAHLWNLIKIGDNWYHADSTNSHDYNNFSFFLKGNQQLLSNKFNWTTLNQSVADANLSPDQAFTSGDYQESLILERIQPAKMELVESESTTTIREEHEALILYRTNLQLAMDAFTAAPSTKTYNALYKLSQQATEKNGKLEYDASVILFKALSANYQVTGSYYKTYLNALRKYNSGGNEQTALTALNTGKDILRKIKEASYINNNSSSYITNISSNNKSIATYLAKLYIYKAQTTLKKSYKDKAISLSKEFGLADLLAKASKVKVYTQ